MSTIIEREKNLIKAMKAQNFEAFFEGDADDAYDTIVSAMGSFVDYQNHVITMGIIQPTLYARYEGQELRDKVMDLDQRRKSKHDAAIANMSMLNRICNSYGVERISPVDTRDRYAVAEFIGNFCAEIYEENRSGKQLSAEKQGEIVDQHVKNNQAYDRTVIERRVRKLDAEFGDMIAEYEKQKQRGPDYGK